MPENIWGYILWTIPVALGWFLVHLIKTWATRWVDSSLSKISVRWRLFSLNFEKDTHATIVTFLEEYFRDEKSHARLRFKLIEHLGFSILFLVLTLFLFAFTLFAILIQQDNTFSYVGLSLLVTLNILVLCMFMFNILKVSSIQGHLKIAELVDQKVLTLEMCTAFSSSELISMSRTKKLIVKSSETPELASLNIDG